MSPIKPLKYAKSDGWSCLKHWSAQICDGWSYLKHWSRSKSEGWRTAKMLKNAKSDGWNFRKHRTTQNLIVEVA